MDSVTITYLFLSKTSCFKSEQLYHRHCYWYTSNFTAVSLSGSELHRAGKACSHSNPGKRSDAVYEVPGAVQLHYQETPPLQSMRTCECYRYTQHTILTTVRRWQSNYLTPVSPNITNFIFGNLQNVLLLFTPVHSICQLWNDITVFVSFGKYWITGDS